MTCRWYVRWNTIQDAHYFFTHIKYWIDPSTSYVYVCPTILGFIHSSKTVLLYFSRPKDQSQIMYKSLTNFFWPHFSFISYRNRPRNPYYQTIFRLTLPSSSVRAVLLLSSFPLFTPYMTVLTPTLSNSPSTQLVLFLWIFPYFSSECIE